MISACWRGYVATWRIVDNKLFLEKIDWFNKSRHESIVELFERNNIQYQEKDGMIFANWYTQSFYEINFSDNRRYRVKRLYPERWLGGVKRKLVLQIENGIVTKK